VNCIDLIDQWFIKKPSGFYDIQMNVFTFEDLEEHCSTHPCTKEEFVDLVKRCVFRNPAWNRQGTYQVMFRSPNGPVTRLHTLAQLNNLLARIEIGLLVPTNASSLVCWKNVAFNASS
jgi:hypothetical protein